MDSTFNFHQCMQKQSPLANINLHQWANNYFMMCRRYSGESAGHNLYSYSYTHSTGYGSYKFIGMDACLSLGPRRPFNFFGVLHDVR